MPTCSSLIRPCYQVSHKYSATIPRLTSFSAAINTCLIFVLAADLPPSGPGPWAPDSPRSEGQAQSSTPSSAGVSSDVSGVDLGVCRVSAVEGVECGCFGFGFGHGRRHDGGNTEAMHGRSSSNEVEVRDDERIVGVLMWIWCHLDLFSGGRFENAGTSTSAVAAAKAAFK